MTDQPCTTDFDRLEPPLDSAVRAVLAEPLPEVAIERVKVRAKSLDPSTATLARPMPGRPSLMRRIWLVPVARYGSLAAAVMLLVGIASLSLFIDRTSGHAFAQMIENVKQADTVQLTMTMQMGRELSHETKMYIKGNRARTEALGESLITVIDFSKKRSLLLDPHHKVAMPGELDGQEAKKLANPIDQLRRVKPKDAENIGEETVNGHLTNVYRLRKIDFWGMSGTGQMMVWVDPKDGLPVKIVIHDPNPQAETTIQFEDFIWNKPLDDSLFSLSIPEGYKTEVLQALVPRKESAKPSPPPQYPDPRFAEGILSSNRVPSRIVWNQSGTALTALMRDPESVPPLQRESNKLRQWNVTNGDLLWSVDVSGASSFAASATDGSLATVIGYELQLRDPATGQVTQKWTTEKRLLPSAFSPDGKTLAAGIAEWGRQPSGEGQAGGVQFWSVEHGTLIRSVSDENPTTFIRYAPDGQLLASTSNSGPIKLWNTTTGELVRIFPSPGKIDFSPDGRFIACIASQPLEGDIQEDVRKHYDVQIYEFQTGKLIQTLTSNDHTEKSWVLWIAFSPNGRLVAAANWDGTVKLWEVATGELKKTITNHEGGVHTCVFSPDGKTLATGGENRTLRLWNVDQLLAP